MKKDKKSIEIYEQAMRIAYASDFEEAGGEIWFTPEYGVGFALANTKNEVNTLLDDLSKPITPFTKSAHVLVLNAGVAKLIRGQSIESYKNSNPRLKGRMLASWTLIQD